MTAAEPAAAKANAATNTTPTIDPHAHAGRPPLQEDAALVRSSDDNLHGESTLASSRRGSSVRSGKSGRQGAGARAAASSSSDTVSHRLVDGDNDDAVVDAMAADVDLESGKPGKGDKKGGKGGDRPDPAALGMVPWTQLFRYADRKDKFLMAVGSIGAVVNGAVQPFMFIILADMITAFTTYDTVLSMRSVLTPADFDARRATFFASLMTSFYQFLGLALGSFIASYATMACWQWAGESQTLKIKHAYFAALLRQECGYFDGTKRGELTGRINSDTEQIADGVSDKVGVCIQYAATFVVAWIIAFVRGPTFAAILLVAVPFIMGSAAMLGRMNGKFMREALAGYARAGGIAEEVLSAVRTVVSFGGEQRETARYAAEVQHVAQREAKKGTVAGVGFGGIWFFLYASYAMGFWAGAKLMGKGVIDVGQLVNVFGEFIVGSFSLGHIAPHVGQFISARAAAFRIFEVIERKSKVDPFDESGLRPERVQGTIEFRDVNFAYPTRPHVPVLRRFNLTVRAGQTVALVGESGSGKSTTVGLLERYYVPQSGSITLDGIPIEDLNVHWLRARIGYVGQEPVLFNGTLRENIKLGAPDPEARARVTDEQVWDALRSANAMQFVQDLPDQLDTPIGETGANLSGGQRQRIAIARALIADPRIVLLDEATSALDASSERIVQTALDNAALGRTTVVIAHRLSTVRNADLIVAMRKGEIIEMGTHEELIDRKGYYYALVRDQQFTVEDEEDKAEDDDDGGGSSEEGGPHGEGGALLRRRHSMQPSIKSSGSAAAREMPHIKDEVDKERSPIRRVFKMNRDQWHWISVGVLSATIAGSITPVYAFVYANAVGAFGKAMMLVNGHLVPDSAALDAQGSKWGLIFLGIAVLAGIANYIQTAAFTASGEAVVYKMRVRTFAALVAQEGAFFDRKENSVGALTSKLAVESNMVRKLVGDTLGTIVAVGVSVLVGCILALTSSWQLALLAIVCAPFILISNVLQSRALRGIHDNGGANPASQLASEVVGSVRTVASLGLEQHFVDEFERRLEEPKRAARRGALIGATTFGVSGAVIYLVYALAFIYAGHLMDWGLYTFSQLFSAITTVVFSAMIGGRIGTFMPDFAKAQIAAVELFRLIDRVPWIDARNPPADALRPTKVRGEVTFDNVHFRYPTRPKVRVHRGLTFTVPAGAKVALVGASGCGKSTVIQQLERFYDPERGTIALDGADISQMDVNVLRSHVALVGQQPVLFDGTIFDNILYGATDPSKVRDEEVYAAAKAANVHDFILKLPLGYSTPAGEKGGMLSGGQKQRIAIARALMRKSTVLLLDEATSALDAESEVLVAAALDAAAHGRTTITIAHRLSTIQNADLILVFHGGRVVEQGTHRALIAQRGVYFDLVQTQMEKKADGGDE